MTTFYAASNYGLSNLSQSIQNENFKINKQSFDGSVLQTAYELSMFDLSANSISAFHGHDDKQPESDPVLNKQQQQQPLLDDKFVYNISQTAPEYNPNQSTRKSLNTTVCVPVPTSEHVAEIVGRQGCKIKALRVKTNTYIKTPIRGEKPMFVVTGRADDVAKAKSEIIAVAEHFTVIRSANRKTTTKRSDQSNSHAAMPGNVTCHLTVPQCYVGLIVGQKGATIKLIQRLTNTFIMTNREKQPIFEITGLPDCVQDAIGQIKSRIGQHIETSVKFIETPTNRGGLINNIVDQLAVNCNSDQLINLF